jgi:hypothetical protein
MISALFYQSGLTSSDVLARTHPRPDPTPAPPGPRLKRRAQARGRPLRMRADADARAHVRAQPWRPQTQRSKASKEKRIHHRGAESVAPLAPPHHHRGCNPHHAAPEIFTVGRAVDFCRCCSVFLISGSAVSRAALARERARACQRTCAVVLGELVRAVSRRGPGGPGVGSDACAWLTNGPRLTCTACTGSTRHCRYELGGRRGAKPCARLQ